MCSRAVSWCASALHAVGRSCTDHKPGNSGDANSVSCVLKILSRIISSIQDIGFSGQTVSAFTFKCLISAH